MVFFGLFYISIPNSIFICWFKLTKYKEKLKINMKNMQLKFDQKQNCPSSNARCAGPSGGGSCTPSGCSMSGCCWPSACCCCPTSGCSCSLSIAGGSSARGSSAGGSSGGWWRLRHWDPSLDLLQVLRREASLSRGQSWGTSSLTTTLEL